jgi:hypothetical protein
MAVLAVGAPIVAASVILAIGLPAGPGRPAAIGFAAVASASGRVALLAGLAPSGPIRAAGAIASILALGALALWALDASP